MDLARRGRGRFFGARAGVRAARASRREIRTPGVGSTWLIVASRADSGDGGGGLSACRCSMQTLRTATERLTA